jgi:hypothetical protein
MKRLLPFGFALLIAVNGAALAQQPAPGQSLQYKITQGAAKGPSQDYTLNISIASTDPDGTKHGTVVIDAPFKQKSNPTDVTVSPAGAVNVKMDMNPPGFHMFMSKAEQQNAQSQGVVSSIMMAMSTFNQVATACGQQKALKPGATWNSSAGSNFIATELTFTAKGMEQHGGRNTMHVTFQNASTTAQMQITGEGYYDPAAHLVVSTHFTQSQGGAGQGSLSYDIGLVNG